MAKKTHSQILTILTFSPFVAASLPIPLPSKTPLHQVPPAYQLRILRVIPYEYKRVISDERRGK